MSLHCSALYCTAPSMPPNNVTATSISSTSIQLTWYPVPPISQNGDIIKYQVEYITFMFSTVPHVNTTPPTTLTINLVSLEEYAEYSFQIRAYTEVGPGPYSQPVTATTMEDGKECTLH